MLAPTQVWTLANYLLTTREAKRVFGLVGAGGITGWIFSGLLASALARIPGLGTESLLLVMAVILVGCCALVIALWRERAKCCTRRRGARKRIDLAEHAGEPRQWFSRLPT